MVINRNEYILYIGKCKWEGNKRILTHGKQYLLDDIYNTEESPFIYLIDNTGRNRIFLLDPSDITTVQENRNKTIDEIL